MLRERASAVPLRGGRARRGAGCLNWDLWDARDVWDVGSGRETRAQQFYEFLRKCLHRGFSCLILDARVIGTHLLIDNRFVAAHGIGEGVH
jgi:hypothetical protein